MRQGGTAFRPRVPDIVAAAGLSNDAYRHFPSKDALVARLRSYVRMSPPAPSLGCWWPTSARCGPGPQRDGGARYAAAPRAAGVPVGFTEYVGMPHGYLDFPGICRRAPQALAGLCAEQTAALVQPLAAKEHSASEPAPFLP